MTTAFLISHDNGQDWEDHRRRPLFLVETREQADAIVAEVKTWIVAQRNELPPFPDTSVGEWDDAAYDRRQNHINALTPPFGIDSLLDAVDDHGSDVNASLIVTEIPFYNQRYTESI